MRSYRLEDENLKFSEFRESQLGLLAGDFVRSRSTKARCSVLQRALVWWRVVVGRYCQLESGSSRQLSRFSPIVVPKLPGTR